MLLSNYVLIFMPSNEEELE